MYSDLLAAEGSQWDVQKLETMFTITPDDVLDTKQIAIGGPGRSDYIAWNFTKEWPVLCEVCLSSVYEHEGFEVRTAGIFKYSGAAQRMAGALGH